MQGVDDCINNGKPIKDQMSEEKLEEDDETNDEENNGQIYCSSDHE